MTMGTPSAQASSKAIIVTGSSGLLGSAVIQRMAPRYRIHALDLVEPDEELPAGVQFHKIDLTNDDSVHETVQRIVSREEGIASVVHLAAFYDFSGDDSPMYEKVTVEGTRRMLRALQGTNTEQFIFSSTMLVHAPTERGKPIDEESPLEAKWPYPQSKVQTEHAARGEHEGIPLVILRIAGAYTDECDSIPIAHQIQRIYEDRVTAHVYPGDLNKGQAFIHLEDLTDAFEKTIERRSELGDEITLLIGEPETYGYGRLQEEIGRLVHGDPEWTTRNVPRPVAKAGAKAQDEMPGVDDPFIKPWMVDLADDHYELDISRARQVLDWQPQRRLIDVLPSMVKALKEDPDGWYKRHDLKKE
jgi:nucleoside-diphosphate-sugar epimerase